MSSSNSSDRSRATAHLEIDEGRVSAEPLRECVRHSVDNYFRHLDGHEASGLFDLVMSEVEAPLLEATLAHAGGNQSRAAAMLGINRATLRKKLQRHGLV